MAQVFLAAGVNRAPLGGPSVTGRSWAQLPDPCSSVLVSGLDQRAVKPPSVSSSSIIDGPVH